MQHVFGMDAFDYLGAHPQEAAIFNEAMAEITRQVARAVVAAYDFARFRTIVDVGGGNGTLIGAILDAEPKLRGIVFDSPSGSAEAPRQLEAAGLADRCEVIAGDFFRSVPSGADAYILKSIIHDWGDERSVTILRNCREAISADGKLLLVERVMPARVEASASHQRWTMIDMHMLLMLGGRERTESEFQALFCGDRV
jgi:precorrin-6B methylase 2